MPTQSCPVCGAAVPLYDYDASHGARIECPVCGTYRLMEYARQILAERRFAAGRHGELPPLHRLSAALREQSESGVEPVLDDPDAFAASYTPAADPIEVMDRILAYLSRKGTHASYVPLRGHRDHGVAGAETPAVFDYALAELATAGLVERKALDEAAYRLTPAGWRDLRKLGDRAAGRAQATDPRPPQALVPYVADLRIEALRTARQPGVDLRKLVRLCEELNFAWANNALYSVAMLVRAIIDHVPPLFQARNFGEVANNVSGSTIKGQMQRLDRSARDVGSTHLHGQVRATEVPPTPSQVNFASDLDVLLGEITRRLSGADP